MLQLKLFVFNTFQVNTYLLYDETGEAAIIDPGCFDHREERQLDDFIRAKNLKLVMNINTHPHIDHILGNSFVFRSYGLRPLIQEAGLPLLKAAGTYGSMFGIKLPELILPDTYLVHGQHLTLGQSTLEVRYTPGHADGSICLYNQEKAFIIVGDVLFYEGIGRTDLPTGNYNLLMDSINNQILSLSDDTWVYPGHGHETTVGHEKNHNPFLVEGL